MRLKTLQNNQFKPIQNNDLITTQLYEGIVIKRLDAKLQFGFVEKNNFQSTLKCRKATLNYKF